MLSLNLSTPQAQPNPVYEENRPQTTAGREIHHASADGVPDEETKSSSAAALSKENGAGEKSFAEKLEEKFAPKDAPVKDDGSESVNEESVLFTAEEEGLFEKIMAALKPAGEFETEESFDGLKEQLAGVFKTLLTEMKQEESELTPLTELQTEELVALLVSYSAVQQATEAKNSEPVIQTELGFVLGQEATVSGGGKELKNSVKKITVGVSGEELAQKKTAEERVEQKSALEILEEIRQEKRTAAGEIKSDMKSESSVLKQQSAVKTADKAALTPTGEADMRNEPIVIVADRRTTAEALKGGAEVKPEVQLSQALRESGNTEIVQRAQVILSDQNSGEIRLTLRPENLGTVRINLSLEEGRIFGRIIVDSNSAKAAFDENMADLRDAMLKSGFLGAELDVSVGSRQPGQQHEEEGKESRPFFSERLREGGAFERSSVSVHGTGYNEAGLNIRA